MLTVIIIMMNNDGDSDSDSDSYSNDVDDDVDDDDDDVSDNPKSLEQTQATYGVFQERKEERKKEKERGRREREYLICTDRCRQTDIHKTYIDTAMPPPLSCDSVEEGRR
ncbi:hypothetical protein WUBG_14964 [Wuchereria bancrofti]|uniref:Uncharacterized protein n=1 Tax=Wuchereria bancrofti TaxID=6293 RepID=J9AIZ5_WUCBA|nr:hypothetical protein WUBG_14964 [Wuchereria bancrofti]